MSLRNLPASYHAGLKNSARLLALYRDFLKNEGVARGIVGPKEGAFTWSRHVVDSLAVLGLPEIQEALQPTTGKIFDFGSGGGLPGVPLALVLRSREFVLIDSQRRRLDFIRDYLSLAADRNLDPPDNITLVHGRLEDKHILERYSGTCSLGFSRAFLPPGVAVELVGPYLQRGGTYVIYAGQSHEQQSSALSRKLKSTDLTLQSSEVFLNPVFHRYLVIHMAGRPPEEWPRRLKKIKQEWDELTCQE